MAENQYVRPWAQSEQIDIPATGLKRGSTGLWRNGTSYPIVLEHILIDSESVTTTSVRMGVRGRRAMLDDFVSTLALQNELGLQNAAVDAAWPIWRFGKPIIAPARQQFSVELADTVSGGARICSAIMHGHRACSPSEPVSISDTVSIPSGGKVVAQLRTDDADPLVLDSFQLWLNETGSAANLRGLQVKVSGGGLPAWMDQAIRGSLLFPDRNPAAGAIWSPGREGLVLLPGETLDIEFRDTSGAVVVVYLGAVGHAADLRS